LKPIIEGIYNYYSISDVGCGWGNKLNDGFVMVWENP
jgi:hypothetical protein